MKAFRDYLSFWNEAGLLVSGLMVVGYFGSRGMLGRLPMFLAVIAISASAVLAFLISNAQAPVADDGFMSEKPRFAALDRFVGLFLLFLLGVALAVFLGAIV